MAQIVSPQNIAALTGAQATPKVHSLAQRLLALLSLSRQRHALAGLDDHQLADIGVTRAEAEAEAGRALWDAPAHWQS